jgi:flagellar biosynthesis GTPase FlhF
MPCVSTQTTTFLPAVVPVLKSQRLPKRFLARMMRKHGKEVKQTNTIRAKLQREVAANKKALLKILKDMTLTVRKNKAETKKALNEANKAAKESAKADKESAKTDKEAAKKAKQKAKEQKLFDAAVNQFSKELKAAAKKEEETEMKEQKKFDKAARKFAADQKKLDHISKVAKMRAESAVQNYAAAQVITNNTNDSVFIPFLGFVSA